MPKHNKKRRLKPIEKMRLILEPCKYANRVIENIRL